MALLPGRTNINDKPLTTDMWKPCPNLPTIKWGSALKGLIKYCCSYFQCGGTGTQKALSLLTMLPTRGPKAFEAFVEALQQSEQEHLAQMLLEGRKNHSGKQQVHVYTTHWSATSTCIYYNWSATSTMYIGHLYNRKLSPSFI